MEQNPIKPDWALVLDHYKKKIETAVREDIASFGPASPLRDACEYALLQSGSNRIRSTIVLMLGKALGCPADLMLGALGIEYIIMAAKAADDFPAMDNTDQRGEVESLHKKYGEGTALLASYSLLAAGFRCLARASEKLAEANVPYSPESDRRLRTVIECVSWNIGAGGASLGQYRDLVPSPGLSLEQMVEIIDAKTGSLYEMAFVTGWMLGGGDWNALPTIREAGRHLGKAMQMQDDLADQAQDAAQSRPANIGNAFGFLSARQQLLQEVKGYVTSLRELPIERGELLGLAEPIMVYLRAYNEAAAVNC